MVTAISYFPTHLSRPTSTTVTFLIFPSRITGALSNSVWLRNGGAANEGAISDKPIKIRNTCFICASRRLLERIPLGRIVMLDTQKQMLDHLVEDRLAMPHHDAERLRLGAQRCFRLQRR